MLSSDGDTDVFFDAEDQLPSLIVGEVGSSKLGYEIWMNEPQSVKKRRETFLQEIGLIEISSSRTCAEDLEIEPIVSSNTMDVGLERLTESSGAVSNSENGGFNEENTIRLQSSVSNSEFQHSQGEALNESCQNVEVGKKKMKAWWKFFMNRRGRRTSMEFSEESVPNLVKSKRSRMKVFQNKKSCSEFSALYLRQQIYAHKGLIWSMKFSPDGKYLASGGEDGVVRVWRVTLTNASNDFLSVDNKFREGKTSFIGKQLRFATVVIPEKVFQIDELPIQEFHGHSSDVLDIAWSNSNCLLSSSKDKTVRLWSVDSDQCLNVFHHKNYVTCIQFNPTNENHFISGSIDGKIRIWGVSEQRVVDWVDARDITTAISYQPDGKGFVVGSITGVCRFYEASGDGYFHLNAQLNTQGRKKASGKRITGIQFCRENSRRVMITSDDSKVRIFEGTEIVKKYKGLPKSGSQMSASFTQSEKHIISVGEDSHIYMWNHETARVPSSKETKSLQSCEHFFSDGVSVAIPWTEPKSFGENHNRRFSPRHDFHGVASLTRDSECFSLSNWFSPDSLFRGSATWPEEKLPLWDSPVADEDGNRHRDHHQKELNGKSNANGHDSPPKTWGLVIVTAGFDGTIKVFQNYGLPIRL